MTHLRHWRGMRRNSTHSLMPSAPLPATLDPLNANSTPLLRTQRVAIPRLVSVSTRPWPPMPPLVGWPRKDSYERGYLG